MLPMKVLIRHAPKGEPRKLQGSCLTYYEYVKVQCKDTFQRLQFCHWVAVSVFAV